jgi:membrane-anchored protein YejM (alkaline phosphatase superfamily)
MILKSAPLQMVFLLCIVQRSSFLHWDFMKNREISRYRRFVEVNGFIAVQFFCPTISLTVLNPNCAMISRNS